MSEERQREWKEKQEKLCLINTNKKFLTALCIFHGKRSKLTSTSTSYNRLTALGALSGRGITETLPKKSTKNFINELLTRRYPPLYLNLYFNLKYVHEI